MKTIQLKLLLAFLFLQGGYAMAQCTGGTNGGSLTMNINWQTTGTNGKYYYSFSAVAGNIYYFSYCAADGGSSTYNTEITINTNAGVAVAGAYNDDYCGTQSYLAWTCVTSGTYRVVVTKKTCSTQIGIGTLAYRYDMTYTCPAGLGTGVTNVPALPYSNGAGTTCGAVNDVNSLRMPACGTANYYAGEDMVWIFTPATSGFVSINLSTAASNVALALFQDCPLNGNGGVCLGNSQGNGDRSLTICLTAGQTYYIVVDAQLSTGCFAFSNLTISSPFTCNLGSSSVAVPSLPYSSTYRSTCGKVNNFTSANTPSCGDNTFKAQEDEIFYFTPAVSGDITIQLISQATNTGVYLYDGCPNPCSVSVGNCVANQTGSGNKTLCVTVTAGTTYFLLIDSKTACFAYNLFITAPAVTKPGITCGNPFIIPSLPFKKFHETTACYGNDYTSASPGSCGTSYESGEDKVYRLTVASAQCISITLTGASSNNIGYQVYNGCPDVAGTTCVGSLGGATGGTLTGSVSLPAAGTYFIVVDSWSQPFNVDYNLNISNNNTVYNDLPCNAQTMELGLYYTGSNHCAGSAGEPVAPLCWTTPNVVNTVWYSFIAPVSGSVTVRTSPGSLKRTMIAVYSGVCGSSLSLVSCNVNAPGCGVSSPTATEMSELSLTGLTAGTIYYIMVDGAGSSTGTFSIIAIDAGNVLPDISGQECNSPILVCNSKTQVGDPGFQSFGNICDFPGAGSNCLTTAERGSAWYQISIASAGNLEFSIVPNDWVGAPSTVCTDYDFALWKIAGAGATTCSGIAGGAAPIKCNYSALGITGLNSGSNGNAPAAYPGFGGAFNSRQAVVAGEVYVLIVSNYSNSTSGFTLNFPVTAPVDYSAGTTMAFWTGAEDNDWFNANNWGGCNIPSCSVDAIIPLSGADQPYIGTPGAACRSLKVEPGGSLNIDNNQSLSVCGSMINNGEIIAANGTTFTFNNAAVNQSIGGNLISPNKFGNFTVNKTGGIVSLNENLDLQGALTIQTAASRMDALNKTISLRGNLACSGKLKMGTTGNLIFTGTTSQLYSNADTATNIIINKASSSVTLTSNMLIGATGNLILTVGKITTGASYEVNVLNDASSAVPAGTTTSYIEGFLRRKVPAVQAPRIWEFPLGNSTKGFQRMSVNFYNGIDPLVVSLRGRYTTPPTPVNNLGIDPTCMINYGDTMTDNGYWSLTPTGSGIANANITLYNRNYTNAKTQYTVGQNVNGTWAVPAIVAGACLTSPVTAVLRNGVANSFVAGQIISYGTAQGYVSPLPVELVSLQASPAKTSIIVTWKTVSEKNNAGFYLQRSSNGVEFENIQWINGNGTTNSLNAYSFDDKKVRPGIEYFYRLNQFDFDGTATLSDIVSATIGSTNLLQLKALPNPYSGNTYIHFNLPQEGKVTIVFSDVTGRIVKKMDLGMQSTGEYRVPFSAVEAGFGAGIYNVTLTFNDTPYRIQISEMK